VNDIYFERTHNLSGQFHPPMVVMIVGSEARGQVAPEFQVTINANIDFNVWNKKLEQLRNLGNDWNGYATPAPSDAAIVTAKAFLSAFLGTDFEPSRLAPSVSGGVGITHKNRSRRVYVEFFNDGDVCVLFSDGESDPRSRRVKPAYGKFEGLIDEIREYLDA
jgi:hypothetical protein